MHFSKKSRLIADRVASRPTWPFFPSTGAKGFLVSLLRRFTTHSRRSLLFLVVIIIIICGRRAINRFYKFLFRIPSNERIYIICILMVIFDWTMGNLINWNILQLFKELICCTFSIQNAKILKKCKANIYIYIIWSNLLNTMSKKFG